MKMLLCIVWFVTSCSIILGYMYYVNTTLDKIWDDKSLSYEEARKMAYAKRQEIADIGTCMLMPLMGIAGGGVLGLIVVFIVHIIIN